MNIREITSNNKFVEHIIVLSKNNDLSINTADNGNDSIILEVDCKNASAMKKSALLNSISDTIIAYYDDVTVYNYKIKKDKVLVEFSGIPKD